MKQTTDCKCIRMIHWSHFTVKCRELLKGKAQYLLLIIFEKSEYSILRFGEDMVVYRFEVGAYPDEIKKAEVL